MKPSIILKICGSLAHLLAFLLFGVVVGQVAGDCSQIFEYLVLQRHNEFRHRHGVGQLHINATLTREAQLLANRMKAEDRLLHDSPLGENLYAYWHPAANAPDASRAVDRWYSEVAAYQGNFGHEPDLAQQSRWIHFTNLIWRQSTEIGVGCSVSKSEETSYLVVRYWPVGNVPGHYAENVLPMLSASTQVVPYVESSTAVVSTAKPVLYSKPTKSPSYTTPTSYSTARTTTLYPKPVQYVTIKVPYNKPNVTAPPRPTVNLIQVQVSTTKPPYSKPAVYLPSSTTVYTKPTQPYSTAKPAYSTPNTYTTVKPAVYTRPAQYSTTSKPYYTSSARPTANTTVYQAPIEPIILNLAYNSSVTYPPVTTTTTTTTTITAQPAYVPPNRPISQLIIHHGPYGAVFNQPIPIYNPLPYRPVAPQRPNVAPILQYYPDKPYQSTEVEKPVQMPNQMPSNSYLPILPVQPVIETYDPQQPPYSSSQQTKPPPPVYRPPKPIENEYSEQPMFSMDQQQQYQPPKPIVINALPEYRPPPAQSAYVDSSKPPSSYEYNKPTRPPFSHINYYHPPKPITSSPAKPNDYYNPTRPTPNQTPKPTYLLNYYIPNKPISSQPAKPPQNIYYFPPKPVAYQPNRPQQSLYRPPKPIDHIDPDSPHLNFDDNDADDLLETAFELADDYDKKDKEKDIENMKNVDKIANDAKKNAKVEQRIKTNENKNKNTVFREINTLKRDDYEDNKTNESEKVIKDNKQIRKTKKTTKSMQKELAKKSTNLNKYKKSGKSRRSEDDII